MAVEVYKSTVPGSVFTAFEPEMWGLGNFFSSSSQITIIDSYTSHWWSNYPTTPEVFTAKRYKGDPFADSDGSRGSLKVWDSVSDLGAANNWIVIECQTEYPSLATLGYTGLPKWQCKIQWQEASTGFADVSDPTGVLYPLNHNTGRDMYWRFCPWGGWDLADVTPDFAPAGAPAVFSSENRKVDVSAFGGGDVMRDYVVVEDGYLMRWCRKHEDAFNPLSLSLVLGDVIPVHTPGMSNHMVMPRAMLANGGTRFFLEGHGDAKCICWPPNESYSGDYTANDSIGVTFWNDLLSRVEEGFVLAPAGRYILEDGFASPGPYDSYQSLDFFPYMIAAYTTFGIRFSLPGVRVGWGMGFNPVASKQWVSTYDGDVCAYLRWDGSSDLF